MPEAGRATAAEAKHHSRQGARAQGRLCAPIFSTLSMESMNGHVDCGQLAHGSISCRRNTWGHHQQRARTVWLGNARLRAEQGKSARVGGFKRELANHRLERRCTAASSVEEEGERIAVHHHRRRVAFEKRSTESNRHLCSHVAVITPCALSQVRNTVRRVAHRGGAMGHGSGPCSRTTNTLLLSPRKISTRSPVIV